MSPLNQQLLQDAPWFFNELGFRVIRDHYDAKAFGNCIVTLDSETLRANFVKDRGQILLYLAPCLRPDDWRALVFILETIQGVQPAPRFELDAVASLFRENYPALVEALGPKWQETRQELQRLSERLYAVQHEVRTTKAGL